MLGWISTDFFARSPMLIFPALALCIFIAVFTVATVRALLQDRGHIERLARLPFEDDQETDHG